MKVLVCHNRYRSDAPSGENRVVDDEIALMTEVGIDVVPMIEESDSLEQGGVVEMSNAALGPVYSPTGVRRFRELLRTERPDVVHLHNVFPLISPAVVRVAHRAGVHVVQTVHNYRHTCIKGLHFRDGRVCDDCVGRSFPYPGVLHSCYRGSMAQSVAMVVGQSAHRGTWRSVDRFLTLTPFMASRLREIGVDASRITVRPSWTADPGESSEPGTDVLYLGRLDEAKGVPLLLDAWLSRGRRGDRKLRIAGSGPLEDFVRAAALRHDDVEYLGNLAREEAAAAVRASGVVAVPSRSYEGFPLTVVEAWAQGRPVIVNARTSTASAMSDELGWILPARADAWRDALDALERAEIRRRGQAARSVYVSRCSPSAAAHSLSQVYEEVMG